MASSPDQPGRRCPTCVRRSRRRGWPWVSDVDQVSSQWPGGNRQLLNPSQNPGRINAACCRQMGDVREAGPASRKGCLPAALGNWKAGLGQKRAAIRGSALEIRPLVDTAG